MMTEDQLERQALEWFEEQGYQYKCGSELAFDGNIPERRDYSQVILTPRLLSVLKRINPDIPNAILEEVASAMEKPEHLSLMANNRHFHELLLDGVSVEIEIDGEKRGDSVKLIDFNDPSNNDFLVVNQFTIKGINQLRRPDIIVFINGLPIAVIELKNPIDGNADIWGAFNQLQTYKTEIPDLLLYNEALIISDGINARIGSLTADKERFMRWRTVKSEHDRPLLEFELETLIKGFFDKQLLLDYIRYFILYEDSGDSIIKKNAGYHQFHAVRQAVKATVIAAEYHEDRVAENMENYSNGVVPGCKKGGVVWHTQGSGKSISMACYAGKLLQQPEMKNPTLVVVTDRNDLDGQLFETFCSAQMLLKQTPVQVESRDALREMLENRPAGGIFFTTIQKFFPKDDEDVFPVLTRRHNIVVIADEAHRSQYGEGAKLNRETGKYMYGYSKYMREGLPNATFVGFTGTPISFDDKDTQVVFGEYVSIYDIQDAVDDGSTVPIYYESRLAKLELKDSDLPIIDDEVEEIIEDDEDRFSRERTKSKWATLEKLVGSKARIVQVAQDIVTHFNARVAAVDGKAMIVCMSRDICAQLYNEIIKIHPEWHSEDPMQGDIKIVMTGSASDKELLRPHIINKRTKKQLEKRFKDPKDCLKIVIVRDMWLTGFDAPICHTMYIDKPMKGHNLMQAIARVNRVFKGKEGGLVVDYIGIANELRSALQTYTQSNGKGNPTIDNHEAFAKFLELIDIVRGIFHGFDYSKYRTLPTSLLIPAANHILGIEDCKKRYFDLVLAMTKTNSLCGTLDEALAYREELAFFQAIKVVISKASGSDRKLTEDQKGNALKQILDNAVVGMGIDNIFVLAGLERPDISILSDEFLEEVGSLPQRNLAVELLQKLLNDEIKSKTKNNVVQEKKFSDRLFDTLKKYRNRSIESSQVIEELIALAKEFREAAARSGDLGLNPDEIAFYDALANNESAVRELGDDILKKIAQEISEKLRKSTSVDWQVRDSVRAKLRNLVRVTLRRYKYPPDKTDEAIELVLKQAEVMANVWSSEM
ncbi:type I restriction endonuclease subunit R [Paenibacillus sp. FA6]|uniref:type I restriction endonuclease subunit R n=1 Tax=Paenibacillus sp. FA6 TaxID=3413029 RepID=UPI003F65DA23